MLSAGIRATWRHVRFPSLLALVVCTAGFSVAPAAATPKQTPAGAAAPQAQPPARGAQPPATGQAGAARGRSGEPAAPAEPRIKALVVSGGCCHDYTGQDKILMETIRKVLPVDWTVVYQGGTARESKIPLYADANWIKGFDIVFHNECFGFVDDGEYVRRITAAHRTSGVPAMFTHCSLHSYRMATVDDWRELLGVTSRRHTAAHAIAVTWVATGDPLVTGLKADWTTPVDELYVIEKTWPNTKVLATAVSPEAGNAVYPVVWTNDYHGARVFGTSLGHQDSWNDPTFQELLVRGFKWALKKDLSTPPAPAAR
ncbi:MAG: ThuA domain-containing protein [Acidobacteriota bacterium]